MNWDRNPDGCLNNIGTDVNRAKYYRDNLDLALQEGVNEFKQFSKKHIINEKVWYIHPNVNLYIDCTSACPCDCEFCIAKTTDSRKGFVMIEAVEKNIELLKKSGVSFTCQVTGGEPTLHPNLMEILKLCAGRKTVINTNFPSVSLDVVDHVNVSCHHYNPRIESEIIRYNRNRMTLKSNIEPIAKKVRLQCNLIGGYIDTFGEIMQYIAWGYHSLSVTNFSFSFLTALPKNILYQQSIIDYVIGKPSITFNDLIYELEKRNHWVFKKYRGGVACYYEVWEYNAYEHPITVIFKYSDNHVLHRLDQEEFYIPDIIIHPNGAMTGSWDSRIKEM